MLPSNSLIIATYNRPDALALCIRSALQQSVVPDEIIVADDGSTASTRAIVEKLARKTAVPIQHIWQEDKGFRLSMIRNKAIAVAKGEYIIQADGDIILHRHFIRDHLRFSKENSFVRASRIYLDEAYTNLLITRGKTRVNIFNKGVTNFFSALHIPFIWPIFESGYKNSGDERWEIHGCNMAFWKKDVVSINGYNEAFSGWGMEDKELVVRLLNSGCEKRFLKGGGIAFHLFHPVNTKERLRINEDILRRAIEEKTDWATQGLSQYFRR